MGAHKMEVPDELKNEQLERAELLINLPAGWQLDEESLKDEKWYWPIRFLKFMARSPVNNGMYYDWGSTLEFDGGQRLNLTILPALMTVQSCVRLLF